MSTLYYTDGFSANLQYHQASAPVHYSSSESMHSSSSDSDFGSWDNNIARSVGITIKTQGSGTYSYSSRSSSGRSHHTPNNSDMYTSQSMSCVNPDADFGTWKNAMYSGHKTHPANLPYHNSSDNDCGAWNNVMYSGHVEKPCKKGPSSRSSRSSRSSIPPSHSAPAIFDCGTWDNAEYHAVKARNDDQVQSSRFIARFRDRRTNSSPANVSDGHQAYTAEDLAYFRAKMDPHHWLSQEQLVDRFIAYSLGHAQ